MAFSQPAPEKVTGLPTRELNDLHVDRNGFLWIAHSLGISRFDGQQFITYSHPAQISLPATDMVEDRQGRLWFHNFSGQVFFIEKGKIHLLESYDYKKENQSPKMIRCGDELLITSYKGLFVCNTGTFSTRFFPFRSSSPTALVSVAVCGNKALIYNNFDWYSYENGRMQKMAVSSPFSLPKDNFISLQPAAFKDTFFLTANPSGILYKLKLDENGLRFLAAKEYHDFINAVSIDKEAWVHTRNQSSRLQDGATLHNIDLTDVVTGSEGSTWYCSRRNGLLVSYHPSLWQKAGFPIGKDDYIRSLNANAGYFFTGTQKGNLYRFASDTEKEDWKLALFNGLGSIDFIRYISNDLFIVGSSTDTYIVDAKEKKIRATLPIQGIADVDFDGSSFYLATAVGLYAAPWLDDEKGKAAWLQQKKKQFPFFNWDDRKAPVYLLFPQRTRSVRYDSLNQRLYIATKNNLFELNQAGAHPYLINGKGVFATAVAFKNATLYISTISEGLWIVDEKGVKQITTREALASNTIIRIKLTEDHLWLFEKNGIQVLDIHTRRILSNLDLPRIEGANVLDVAEKGDAGFLATAEGVYKVPLNLAAPKRPPQGFLDYVIVNGKDTLQSGEAGLSYQQNDVQFLFSSPAYYDPESISFHYRLTGAENEWRVTAPGERKIHYSALTPGDYRFELFAVDNNGMQQQQVISYIFSIEKPWWRTWWAFLLLNAGMVAVIYVVIQNRIREKLRLELMRRNISHDLHDDIGATLSSVNFYIDLAQGEKENTDYLRFIKENVNQVINNLDDLVWSINPKNDTTEQFILRMKDYAIPLLKAASVQCHFEYETRLLQLNLDLLTKRHLYLLFKEIINNVAKHAHCRNCTVKLIYRQGQLCLSVADDGKGFDPAKAGRGRNGLVTMQERTQKLKGKIEIHSTLRQGCRVAVKIPL